MFLRDMLRKYMVRDRDCATVDIWRFFPCVSLVFSAHTSVQICFFSFTALFDTLCLLGHCLDFSVNFSIIGP
jgi:hypothetical protein